MRPSQEEILNNLAEALRVRYENHRNRTDLDEAITYWRQAATFASIDSPLLSRVLINLSEALKIRHKRYGAPSDLDESIETLNKAKGLISNQNPNSCPKPKKTVESILAGYPLISIGQPIVWPIQHFCKPDQIPLSLDNMLGKSDIYIVKFSCSFRPASGLRHGIFEVQLENNNSSSQMPIAFDLYPQTVTEKVEHNVGITINPSIKFNKIETSIFNIDYTYNYDELHPIIVASGIGTPKPNWYYCNSLQGAKVMHLLLMVPKGNNPIFATITCIAEKGRPTFPPLTKTENSDNYIHKRFKLC